MKRSLGALLALVAAVLPRAAQAQRTPLSVEPRVGIVAPVGSTADEERTGFAVGADVIVRVTPLVSVYGGYAWQGAGVAGVDSVDVSFYGWSGGVRLTLEPWGPYTPFLKSGLVYKRGTADFDSGTTLVGDWATGFEVAAGVELGVLGGRAALSPQVGFSSVQNDQWAYVQVGLHVRI
ncbi:MAG TPA: outer membrane beta-barrel protein [Longimicrobium sp.]